ncbi:cupredoxin domain-containing protein [Sphingomonas sp. JC676]|uniref:cupredoxin domain-containing protein n=1 Tax=Sphingomonas sp. JC676 TaxID=2768065 RepID=UPI0016584370|nr:cupredoxin domain-containing protein [Sphingomonas sp. JC676]MBC9030855.1 cupredoxin domain-containing protein [Sphingomonas sp. JC676]
MLDSRKTNLSRRGLLRISGAAALLTFALATTATARSPAPPQKYTVVMGSMSFGKLPSGLKVGDTITWVNRDTVPHTATARDKSFDVRVQQGQSVSMVVKKAGSIAFYCIYHPGMRGTLTVAAQ